MAGVGQAVEQSIGTIDPARLTGRADTNIVTPQATALLADAFRQGVISADDIVSRIGQLGQAKKRAEIDVAGARSVQAQEAISPEAIAARSQGLAANTAQGALQQAQAQAGMQNVDPAAALQAQQIEQQKVLIQYPAVAYFQKLAPAAGIAEPKLSDGTPDYVQMEKIGAELALHQSRRTEAQQQLDNITSQESADGSVLFARTKQGEFVDPKKLQQLRSQATRPFERQAPGTSQTSSVTAPPVVEARAPIPQDMGAARAQLVESGLPPEQVVMLSEQDVATHVAQPPAGKPSVSVTPSSGVGSPVAGGISLGSSGAARQGMASEQQKGLAQASLTKEQLKAIGDSFQTLQLDSPWLTGPVMGRLGTFVLSDNWNTARADFTRATTAILANLAKGIYHETGVLSDKDVARYQKALPGVNDTAPVAKIKLDGVTRDIFNSIDTNIEALRGQGQALTPIVQGMQDAARAELQKLNTGGNAAPAASPAPVITLPSGKRVRRNSNGVFEEVN